jgi:hypothetical protein
MVGGNMFGRSRTLCWVLALVFVWCVRDSAQAALGDLSSVRFVPTPGAFPLAGHSAVAPLLIDERDWPGVLRAARDLQADVGRVVGHSPSLLEAPTAVPSAVVLVGTLGRSEYIDRLVSQGLLDVSAIRGAWEAHLMQVVANPFPGVDQALAYMASTICHSRSGCRRGTGGPTCRYPSTRPSK